MIKDITLGQFYQTDSVIHSLDARVKLGGTFLFLISLFLFRNPFGYALAIVFLAMVIRLSNVPFKYMVRGMKSIIFILAITVLFNLFMTPGNVIVCIWKLKITDAGLKNSIIMILRLSLLVTGSSVMTLTTTPNNLTDGLEKMMGGLKKIKVPVHEIAMMMSIALRFIPILAQETDKIMKAQMARGADFESKKLTKRIKALIPVLVPLFVSAFRRANDLAMAMEARCYRGGEGRTKMKPLIYADRDFIAYGVLILYFVVSVFVGRLRIMNF